jgi:hypothetical protein
VIDIVIARHHVQYIMINPESNNIAAVKAYQKA